MLLVLSWSLDFFLRLKKYKWKADSEKQNSISIWKLGSWLLLTHLSIINNKTGKLYPFSGKLDRVIIQSIQNRSSKNLFCIIRKVMLNDGWKSVKLISGTRYALINQRLFSERSVGGTFMRVKKKSLTYFKGTYRRISTKIFLWTLILSIYMKIKKTVNSTRAPEGCFLEETSAFHCT